MTGGGGRKGGARTSVWGERWRLVEDGEKEEHLVQLPPTPFLDELARKGIVPHTKIYRLNLIFWILMSRGIVRFGQGGLNPT